MRVVQNTASHDPPGGGVEQEPLLGALIRIPGCSGGNLLYDVLNLVHDLGEQGQDQVIVMVVGGDDAVTAKKSLNVLKIDLGPILLKTGRRMWRCPRVGEGGEEPGGEAGKGTAAVAARRSASEMSMLDVFVDGSPL